MTSKQHPMKPLSEEGIDRTSHAIPAQMTHKTMNTHRAPTALDSSGIRNLLR
jgi:hypothetical protein